MGYFIKYLCGCTIEGHVSPPVRCPIHGKGAGSYKEMEVESELDDGERADKKRSAVTYVLSSFLGGLLFKTPGTESKA